MLCGTVQLWQWCHLCVIYDECLLIQCMLLMQPLSGTIQYVMDQSQIDPLYLSRIRILTSKITQVCQDICVIKLRWLLITQSEKEPNVITNNILTNQSDRETRAARQDWTDLEAKFPLSATPSALWHEGQVELWRSMRMAWAGTQCSIIKWLKEAVTFSKATNRDSTPSIWEETKAWSAQISWTRFLTNSISGVDPTSSNGWGWLSSAKKGTTSVLSK